MEKQINEMIAGQLTALDDEELMKELAVLMGDDESVPELPEQPSAPVLPAVPTKPIEQQQQQEQEAAGTEHVQMSENPILS